MRINFERKLTGFQEKFVKIYIDLFTIEYNISSKKRSSDYIRDGKVGLDTFVTFLNEQGFVAMSYYLESNTRDNLFREIDPEIYILASPSYGLLIPDDDPKLVEFKLSN